MNTGDPEHIAALLERISRLVNTDGHSDGLKPVQWEVLRYLAKANRFSNSAAALTAYLGLTKGTVSQSLMALAGKGLVRKDTDRRDRRTTRLSLTPQGRRLLANDPLGDIEVAVDTLPEVTQRQLGNGLSTFLSKCLSARGRQPFGQCHNCRYFARNHPEGGPHRCQLVKEELSDGEADKICFEQSPKRSTARG